ncbi:MAG: SDR family oxidoreductase [Planctomycetota bacterium]|jgi:NAD(P)-dependent dehydrogenase (short-subunit alcohol dehydrogenase family)
MQEKRIVLTGVTRGLGRALAARFAADGHTVLGCGRTEPDLASLRAALPSRCQFDRVDVSSATQVETWAAGLLEVHGAPDLVINNAALINRNAPLWEVPRAEFDRVIDVNLKGVTNVIRAFVPSMIEARRGVLVNFSSGWGRSTAPEVAPYCATKWAIEGLSQALAQELPSGLACVALNPGVIDTEMLQSCFGQSAAGYESPQEWAQRAAPFLLSLGAQHNGRPLSVN